MQRGVSAVFAPVDPHLSKATCTLFFRAGSIVLLLVPLSSRLDHHEGIANDAGCPLSFFSYAYGKRNSMHAKEGVKR